MKIYYICASTNSYSIWYDVILLAIATKEKKREREKKKNILHIRRHTSRSPTLFLSSYSEGQARDSVVEYTSWWKKIWSRYVTVMAWCAKKHQLSIEIKTSTHILEPSGCILRPRNKSKYAYTVKPESYWSSLTIDHSIWDKTDIFCFLGTYVLSH